MQGDVPAPQKYSIAYDKLQENMAEDGRTFLEEQHLTFIEPVCWRLKEWKDMWVKHCEPGGLLS
eukprot:15037104-Heterocapsa_arctica.AAC.1